MKITLGKKVGRKPLAKDVLKDNIISIRLSDNQMKYVDQIISAINAKAPVPVTRTWVLLTMVELGRPALEKKYGVKFKPMPKSPDIKGNTA